MVALMGLSGSGERDLEYPTKLRVYVTSYTRTSMDVPVVVAVTRFIFWCYECRGANHHKPPCENVNCLV